MPNTEFSRYSLDISTATQCCFESYLLHAIVHKIVFRKVAEKKIPETVQT